MSQCNNVATRLTLTEHVSGTTLTWTCTPSSANLSGYGPDSGLANRDIPCIYIIKAYPTPELSNTPLFESQCNYKATNQALNSNVSGTTFSRTCASSSAKVTGYSVRTGGTGKKDLLNDYPTPELSNTPLNKQQCLNMATNLTLTSIVSGDFIVRSCTPSNANMTGFSPGILPLSF